MALSSYQVQLPNKTVATNRGRLINFLQGIQGVAPGGRLQINMPTNCRVHRVNMQCSGIAYQNPVATLSSGDSGTGTFTLTTTLGLITAIAIATTNSSKGAGTYPLTITDTPVVINGVSYTVGQGATGTYTVNGSNVITAAAITLGGIASAVPPSIFFNGPLIESVNGSPVRDVVCQQIDAIARANNAFKYAAVAGELDLFKTEPWRNVNQHNEITSWDLWGQNTYTITAPITPQITAPTVTGAYEFDYFRNARQQGNYTAAQAAAAGGSVKAGDPIMVPFLQPVKYHSFSQAVASGVNNINTLPWDFPISRMWLTLAGAGSITEVDILQDGNLPMQVANYQINQMYGQYGFNTAIFDSEYISDPDQRLFKALKFGSQFVLRVTCASSGTLTSLIESLPGKYA